MKWICIDLLDSYSTSEWKNLIWIDGSSRIMNFENWNFYFKKLLYTIEIWIFEIIFLKN